jgi:hypothetical protein
MPVFAGATATTTTSTSGVQIVLVKSSYPAMETQKVIARDEYMIATAPITETALVFVTSQ